MIVPTDKKGTKRCRGGQWPSVGFLGTKGREALASPSKEKEMRNASLFRLLHQKIPDAVQGMGRGKVLSLGEREVVQAADPLGRGVRALAK